LSSGSSTVIFTTLLGVTFAIWFAREGTLSIHTIFSRRREAFYWVAILFTFALGTAAGDLITEMSTRAISSRRSPHSRC